MDILVQPMQRLTKYGLLLKAVLKNTEEDVERENIQAMVSNFFIGSYTYIVLKNPFLKNGLIFLSRFQLLKFTKLTFILWTYKNCHF